MPVHIPDMCIQRRGGCRAQQHTCFRSARAQAGLRNAALVSVCLWELIRK